MKVLHHCEKNLLLLEPVLPKMLINHSLMVKVPVCLVVGRPEVDSFIRSDQKTKQLIFTASLLDSQY